MSPAAPGRTATPTGRPPLWLVFGVTVTGILTNTMLTPALPDILEDLGVGDDRAGVLVASGTLPGIVMAPMIGLLADRFGRRRVLVPCLAVFGTFGSLAAFAPTFELLVLARLAQGVGSAGLINLAVVIIGDHWEGEERVRLVGRNAAVLTAALATFPPLGGLLTDVGGWRLAFAPYALGLLTAVVVARRLPEFRPGGEDRFLAQLRGALALARTPVISATLATGVVIFVCIFGLFLTAMPVHLRDEFGLDASSRGLMLAVPAIPSTLMSLNLSAVRRRLGVRRLLGLSGLLFTAAFALVGGTDVLVAVVVGAVVFGLAQGVFIPVLQDVATAAAPAVHRGAIVAVWVGAARTGQTVGPLAAAALYGATTTHTAFVAGAGLTMLLAVGLFLGPIRESRVLPPPAPPPTPA